MEFTSKAALVEAMRKQITGSVQMAQKALLKVYSNQTWEEQGSRSVIYHNGKGFMPQDAEFLSGIARWVIAGHGLTPKQYEAVRKLIGKYAGQLVDQSIQSGLIAKPERKGGKYLWGKALAAAKEDK